MAALTIDVSQAARTVPAVTELMQKYGSAETRTELHRRWGMAAQNWVTENFAAQGSLTGSPWAALKPSTIAGRRKGKGSGGPQILQDSGALKRSFVMKFDSEAAVVGSPLFYAEYHEEGRKGPWEIRPKNALALAWPAGPGAQVGGNVSRVKASFSSLATRQTYRKGRAFIFAKKVIHPGYPARRMLPRATDANFISRLTEAGINLFTKLSK